MSYFNFEKKKIKYLLVQIKYFQMLVMLDKFFLKIKSDIVLTGNNKFKLLVCEINSSRLNQLLKQIFCSRL